MSLPPLTKLTPAEKTLLSYAMQQAKKSEHPLVARDVTALVQLIAAFYSLENHKEVNDVDFLSGKYLCATIAKFNELAVETCRLTATWEQEWITQAQAAAEASDAVTKARTTSTPKPTP